MDHKKFNELLEKFKISRSSVVDKQIEEVEKIKKLSAHEVAKKYNITLKDTLQFFKNLEALKIELYKQYIATYYYFKNKSIKIIIEDLKN